MNRRGILLGLLTSPIAAAIPRADPGLVAPAVTEADPGAVWVLNKDVFGTLTLRFVLTGPNDYGHAPFDVRLAS